MMRSMTAFARNQVQADWGTLIWEIRSVNHRYLEMSFRLPESLRVLEMNLRAQIQQQLNRGKIDISLRYQPTVAQAMQINVNQPLIQSLLQAHHTLLTQYTSDAFTAIDSLRLLSWPGVVSIEDKLFPEIEPLIKESFSVVLKNLITEREREGMQLKELISQRFKQIKSSIDYLKDELPHLIKQQSLMIKHRFDEAKINLDEHRLEQELVLYAHKIDIAEEIDRASLHVAEGIKICEHVANAGRRLDFLVQELNREVNTMGAKLLHKSLTQSVIEMKVLIEQIREQIQNVE